jgi:hypothetical protein
VQHLCWGKPQDFLDWLNSSINPPLPAFDRVAIQNDLEEIGAFAASYRDDGSDSTRQLALL